MLLILTLLAIDANALNVANTGAAVNVTGAASTANNTFICTDAAARTITATNTGKGVITATSTNTDSATTAKTATCTRSRTDN